MKLVFENMAMGDDCLAALSDYEFTERLNQTIPQALASLAQKLRRQDYIFGWQGHVLV